MTQTPRFLTFTVAPPLLDSPNPQWREGHCCALFLADITAQSLFGTGLCLLQR